MAKWSDFPDATSEANFLREQLRARDLTIATQARSLASMSQRLEEAEEKLRAYQQEARERMARSGE